MADDGNDQIFIATVYDDRPLLKTKQTLHFSAPPKMWHIHDGLMALTDRVSQRGRTMIVSMVEAMDHDIDYHVSDLEYGSRQWRFADGKVRLVINTARLLRADTTKEE